MLNDHHSVLSALNHDQVHVIKVISGCLENKEQWYLFLGNKNTKVYKQGNANNVFGGTGDILH